MKSLKRLNGRFIFAEKSREKREFMKFKILLPLALSISMLLVAVTLSQPPNYELERKRGSWCDEIWFTPVIDAAARVNKLINRDVYACGEPSSVGTLKMVDDGIPAPGAIPLLGA